MSVKRRKIGIVLRKVRACSKSLSTLRKRAWRICACHGTVMDQSSNQEAAVCRANSAASQSRSGKNLSRGNRL